MGMATIAEGSSPLMASYLQRKKFFEPQLMVNPPPMAEQFLFDLRRMILIARERIRTRRHVPRLGAIAELEDEKDEIQQQQQKHQQHQQQSTYKELVRVEKREPLKATQLQEIRVIENNPKPIVVSEASVEPPLQENLVESKPVSMLTPEEEQDERDQLITMEEIVRQQQLLRQSLNANGACANGTSPRSSPRSTKSADDSGRGDSKKDDADSDCSLESGASTATNKSSGDANGDDNGDKTNSEEQQPQETKKVESVPESQPIVEATLAAKKVTELVKEFESPRLQTKAQSRLITPRKIQHTAKSSLFQPSPIVPSSLAAATQAPLAANPTTISRIPRVTATKSPRLAPKFNVAAPSLDQQQPNPPNFPPPPLPTHFVVSASTASDPEQLRAEKLRDLSTNGTSGFGFSASLTSTAKKRPNAAVSGLPTPSTGAYAVYPSDSMKKSLPRRKKVHMSVPTASPANGRASGPTVV